MKHFAYFFIYFLMGLPSASAVQVCSTLNVTGWTQEQRNLIPFTTYRLAFEAGQDVVPTITGNQVCYDDPTFNVPSVITTASILSKINTTLAQRSVDLANVAVKQQAFTDEISGATGNDVCDASLADIETRIDNRVAALQAQLDATTTAAEVKAHLRNQLYPALGTVFKRIAKCLKARSALGGL